MPSPKPVMMKRILLLLILFGFLSADAQKFNNEWIRPNQTYYKFKVAKSGLFRISKAALDAAGIGTTGVEFFELWKNGEKVPFFTPVETGTLPANGYIEFWGEPNDGKADKVLYRKPEFQHTDRTSLLTDTAVYFLSVNTNRSGLAYLDFGNDVASNSLSPEPYFMHTTGRYFKNNINNGYAVVVGEYLYSSSYDKGEYWSSSEINPVSPLKPGPVSSLFVDSSGAPSTLRIGASGNALNTRTVQVLLNNTKVLDTIMDYFNDVHTSVQVPTSLIFNNTATLQVNNNSATPTDRMVVSYFEITYPRKFNFGAEKNFKFSLPAKNDGYYLEITNFNAGTATPVLYDLTFGQRFVANTQVAGRLRFAIPGFNSEHQFVLVSEDASNINIVNSLVSKTFTSFSNTENQGDYLIITHSSLMNGTNGVNPVEAYKAYRESAAGGSFNVKIIDVDELVDQFAFGIKKHPSSIKNFLRFARSKFVNKPKYTFLIGRGMTYNEYARNQNQANSEKLNLVPTFGSPASDNLLSSETADNPVAATPIGRLSVVSAKEIEDYLEKLIEYESVQKNSPQTIAGRAWMKNVVHVTGSSDPYLGTVLCNYMGVYRSMIQDTLFGANVYTFCKTSTNPVEQLNGDKIADLFEEGISILTYFGHSSSTTLEFNLENPQSYNNPGKYPVFFVNGCNAGNFFTYNPQRLIVNETLSEKFTLAKQRGSIAFVASTHFGIVNYLNLFLDNLYTVMARTDFGKSLGETNRDALQKVVDAFGPSDFYSRMHAEQITINGDPAIKLNSLPKPDYIIEQPQLKINPSFISIADKSFQVKVNMNNIGKAINDSLKVKVQRTYPDGSTELIFNWNIKPLRSTDSLTFDIPVVATRDKGSNKISVTLDPDNLLDEVAENNNSVITEFYVFENEARPVFPYDYSIVNDPQQKLFLSTADPFSPEKQYEVEIDTTLAFNSPLKVNQKISSKGGLIEVAPGISFTDSTVYYWRVSVTPEANEEYKWNAASFIYINGDVKGFNQSHFFQHKQSQFNRLSIDSADRKWKFGNNLNSFYVTNGVYPFSGVNNDDFQVSVNGANNIQSACVGNSIIFNVFEPITLKPWKNVDANGANLYKSGSGSANCAPSRHYNFEFSYMTAQSRKYMMNFMDSIPDGYIVVVRSIDATLPNSLSATWRKDTALYGSNNSLYHRLLQNGFVKIDSVNKRKAWIFTYKKNDQVSFAPRTYVAADMYERAVLSYSVSSADTLGVLTSPIMGPAKNWKSLTWDGTSEEMQAYDDVSIEIFGLNKAGSETLIDKISLDQKTFDLSNVNAADFPFIRLKMTAKDVVNHSAYQLKFWRLIYQPAPEGAIDPVANFFVKDTLEAGEPFRVGIAFKNVSKENFDSLAVNIHLYDNQNVKHTYRVNKQSPLLKGESLNFADTLDITKHVGNNTIYVEFNPEFEQPEQHLFNNFFFRNFYVRPDKFNPVLDVTFDGMHILNQDIVSAKPHIQIKLTDEAKYMLLNDTALTSLSVKYPDGTIRNFSIDGDTVRFTPATTGTNNSATIDFFPNFTGNDNVVGEDYELIVKGKDKSGNAAGRMEYRVNFKVISKPMISNMLNFPNPFSTSTAFVFTLTGSEVPQNLKIQILTVTGKVVREITREELGPLHIGRNITEFKWDGTDQFGQKLANGVYLYRVVSRMNGQAMEKYKSRNDETDRFFNNGYGKMYLMR